MTDKKCLELWKKACKIRDNWTCQRPGCPFCFNQPKPKYLQVHHIIKRTNWRLRHDIKNGITSCRDSHFNWFENNNNDPFIAENLTNFLRTFTDMDYLQRVKGCQKKLNYFLIEQLLLQEIERLNNEQTKQYV